MPDFSCSVGDIQSSTTCSDKGGLLKVFAANDSSIDWATMAGAAYYDDATFTILDWAMNVGGTWAEFTFERKNGALVSTYTIENGFYDVQLTNLMFKGHSAGQTITFGQLVGCCGLILQVHDNNGLARVIGKEYISGAWIDALERGRVIRHLDTHGAYGAQDDRSRNEVDFGAEHSDPLPYSSVTIAAMQAL